jgi:hypothetical protein
MYPNRMVIEKKKKFEDTNEHWTLSVLDHAIESKW